MARVTSRDGTAIAYERQGSGPAVILVTGGLDDGAENAPLARELAGAFTAYNYNRRGRGDSGDTPPYAVEREIEDLDALIAEAGGAAHLYGVSSGGALVLEAAAAGLAVDRLAVYEVPYLVDADVSRRWAAYRTELEALLAEDRRGDAVEAFMRVAGASGESILAARRSPLWPGLERIAHTLAHDAACLGDGRSAPEPRARSCSASLRAHRWRSSSSTPTACPHRSPTPRSSPRPGAGWCSSPGRWPTTRTATSSLPATSPPRRARRSPTSAAPSRPPEPDRPTWRGSRSTSSTTGPSTCLSISRARVALFGDHKPADTIVGVETLAEPGHLIEVEAIAVVD